MSAIFGILRLDGGAVSPRDLERMANMLAHRAPDACRSMVEGAVGLGHGLMRVNREDLFEAQPLRDRDADVTLVADLRLDNREELASAFGIAAAELRDMPDSALVLRAYRTWGDDCAAHLLGDFAFAIWDGRAKKLLLGRDHMGQRCVHFHRGKDFFAFATEIKALWALADVPRKLSEAEIGRYLLLEPNVRAGATLFEGIEGVPAGTTIAFDSNGKVSARHYWEPQASAEHLDRDEAYYIETYRRIFAEAVACRIRRLIAPPALCLSAGYDSAGIAGLSGPVLAAQGRKLIAITSAMPEDYHWTLPCARRWAELCRRDMPHLDVRYVVRGGKTLFTDVEKTCLAADGIPRVEQYVIDALFREAAGAGARLVMDGLGGDNTLNPRGGGALSYFLRSGRFARFLSELAPHVRMSGRSWWQTLRHDVVGALLPRWARRMLRALRRGLAPIASIAPVTQAFSTALIARGEVDKAEMLGQFWFDNGFRARTRRVLRNWTASSSRIDANAAAAHGLDLTRPLMDKRAVEFGLAIPEALYVKNGRNRYLACRALADVYPPEFQTRGRHQDMLESDYVGMLRDCQFESRRAIEDMRRHPTLRAWIDFDKLTKTIDNSVAASKVTPTDGLALRALRAAQFIVWFEGRNT